MGSVCFLCHKQQNDGCDLKAQDSKDKSSKKKNPVLLITYFFENTVMIALPTRGRITLVVMLLLLSFSFHFNLSQAHGQSLPRCPDGYQRNSDGFCFPLISTQSCPVGYQQTPTKICVPDTASQFVNPYRYPT